MKKFAFAVSLLLLPAVTYAQTAQKLLENMGKFFDKVLIPFLLGIAFLFFVINAFRYFIAGGANEQSREKAKALAIYGVSAFVLIIVFWGIVNMFADLINLEGKPPPQSDYVSKVE